jgi:hypothetical protein
MFMHPFLCGVAVTLAVETAVLFVAAALIKIDNQ